MHGLILAGGVGSRLAADGVTEPKPLVRIGGQPQLQRLCETLERLGCETVTCLVRNGVPAARAVGMSSTRRLIGCATPSSLHTLVVGLEAVPPGPVFCTMVDTVMSWGSWLLVWRRWLQASAEGAPLLLALAPRFGGDAHPLLVEIDGPGRVTALGSDLRYATLLTAGVYGIGPAARALARQLAERGVERMRGFLRALVEAGLRVDTVTVPRALDVDRRDDLEEANRWAEVLEP
jgi:molybdopterin-guanine dinucleotide biosynthesis protein A